MPGSSIHFFYEDTSFLLNNPDDYRDWLQTIGKTEQAIISELNYIFCSDAYLHQINLQYLQHDTYTDIITFDNSEDDTLCGDIFISTDRVKENAEKFGAAFSEELSRVMAHGFLHLIGYNDKTTEEKQEMRKRENACLSLRKF